MTREEALKVLDTIPTIGEQVDALEMAIKALEQEPCEDCISRQAVLDALESIGSLDTESDKKYARSVFEALPSVTPQPKAGRWEWVQYDSNPNIGNWHCSECRTIIPHMPEKTDNTPIYKWCPNCGAKMAEPQERDEIACEDFVGGESDAK